MNIARILCPTDFSEASAHAVDLASVIAGWYKARIAALHVVNAAVVVPEYGLLSGGSVDDAALTPLRTATAAHFSQASHAGVAVDETLVPDSLRLSQRPGIRLTNGKPHLQILEVAQEESSDLIVIGVHGRNPLDMMVFGSTTNQVVRRAACPVLTLRR